MGKKIGIIALSSPCRSDIFESGLKYLHELGYKTRVMLDPVREYGKTTHLFSSDSAEARANALHELFRDPEIDFVLSARGAYGSMEVLPHLDFDLLAANSKPLVGFSDTTAVLLALSEKSNCICYHGPSLSSLSELVNGGAGRNDFQILVKALSGKLQKPFGELQLERTGAKGEVEGSLLGGNLTICASLVGTPWEPDYSGKIFFFEEVAVKPYALHRLLLQIRSGRGLQGAAAIIVGGLTDCEHSKGLGPGAREVIDDVFQQNDVPIFWGAPIGHQTPNYPIPLNSKVKIRTDNRLELC